MAVFSALARRADEEEKQVEGGGVGPGLRADCPTGPFRRGGGLVGLQYFIKEEEEKKKEMEGKRREEEEIQYGLVVEEVMMDIFRMVPFPLVSFPCSSCS